MGSGVAYRYSLPPISQGPLRNFDINSSHLASASKGTAVPNRSSAPILKRFQQFFSGFFLGIDPGKIDKPSDPPLTAFLDHRPEVHLSPNPGVLLKYKRIMLGLVQGLDFDIRIQIRPVQLIWR